MDDDGPVEPFRAADLPDLDRLAGNVAGFYVSLQAHDVPEQRAAEFTTVFLQSWIPVILMSSAPLQQGETPA